MRNLPQYLEYCDEQARYIEHVSCAVSVLGDLLEVTPEEALREGRTQSLGFLLKVLGDGMMQRSMEGYAFIHRNCGTAPSMVSQASPSDSAIT